MQPFMFLILACVLSGCFSCSTPGGGKDTGEKMPVAKLVVPVDSLQPRHRKESVTKASPREAPLKPGKLTLPKDLKPRKHSEKKK